MTFTESVNYCLTNYFNFSGRGSRSEYWWFILACMIAGVIGAVIDVATGRQFVETLVSLGTIIPTLAAAARRLHDTDRSGWWQLLAFVPLIGWIVLIVWFATSGTPGANRFGAQPERAFRAPGNA
ncbi:MAG TPA: DUF805 domain-containing protein [Roseiarcus sp.]|nr:DUF805 domain-containing protein [Roseiarcus sp.]